MRFLALSLLLCCAAGCAQLRPPELVASLQTDVEPIKTAVLLDRKARKCWTLQVTPFRDGIVVRSRRQLASGAPEIGLYRVTWGNGVLPQPFMTLEVLPSSYGSEVRVNEGDFQCGFTECRKLGLADHPAKWLAGSEECEEFYVRMHF